MTISKRIEAFEKLGKFLGQFNNNQQNNEVLKKLNIKFFHEFKELIKNICNYNPWFTKEFVIKSLEVISKNLSKKNIEKWLGKYPELYNSEPEPLKKIGVVLAGNIPLVGFHDFLSVLISGNIFLGKLSSKDDKLLPFLGSILVEINKGFKKRIIFTEENLRNFDAIIATGSNNSARYFKYYFKKYPHIIRRNRNGIAIIDGKETSQELKSIGEDIFTYFGLGCRNVSKLFVQENYNFDKFFKSIEPFRYLYNHNKYANNYDYNRSIYLLNRIPHLDNGFCILKEDEKISSPIGVIYYQYYNNLNHLKKYSTLNREQIQCIVSNNKFIEEALDPGMSQKPELWDYADNVDTITFLINICQVLK